MNKLYEEDYIKAIADAIREKNGKTDTYKIADMPQAILDIEGGGQPRLPKEYQEVEYIESTTDGQYIDTGFKHNTSTTSYDFNVSISSLPDTYQCFFGSRTSHNSTDAYYLGVFAEHSFGCIGGNKKDPLGWTAVVNTKYHIIGKPDIGFIINGTTYSLPYTTVVVATQNDYLFGYNSSGLGEKMPMKLYDFKIYDNGVMVREFIPCYRKSDNVIGLYDLVENVFYTNAGTGTFLKGSNV